MSVTPSRPSVGIQLSNVQVPPKVLTKIGGYVDIKDRIRFCDLTTQSLREMSEALNHWPRWTRETIDKIIALDVPRERNDSDSDSEYSSNPRTIRQLKALAQCSSPTFEVIFEALKRFPSREIVQNLLKREGGLAKFLEMVEKTSCEQTQTEMLKLLLCCPDISLGNMENIVRNRRDKTELVQMIISRRSELEDRDACYFLDLFNDSPDDRERIVKVIVGKIGHSAIEKMLEKLH